MLCGSWVIVDKKTGLGVIELFNPDNVKKINKDKYTAVCAYDYLVGLNNK